MTFHCRLLGRWNGSQLKQQTVQIKAVYRERRDIGRWEQRWRIIREELI
jgi:hypothetical protein